MEYCPCPLCGEAGCTQALIVPVRQNPHEKFRIVKCDRCFLAYVSPRPGQEEIADYYGHAYYTTLESTGTANGLKNQGYKIIASNPRFQRLLRPLLNFHIILPPPFGHKRVLDIGCGNGRLLDRFRSCGWETYGTEMLSGAAQIAKSKGHDVRISKDVETCGWPPGYFDVIVLCHALEHFPNPLDLLSSCWKLLSDDGLIAIEVPNFGCRDSNIYGASWLGLQIPQHLVHWTKATLGAALEKCHFSIERWDFYSPKWTHKRGNVKQFIEDNPATTSSRIISLWTGEILASLRSLHFLGKQSGALYGHFMTVYGRKTTGN